MENFALAEARQKLEKVGFLNLDLDVNLDLFQEIERLKKEFPAIPVKTVDERYTSKMASRAMIDMGMKKKQRQEKGMVDQIAATIMLQEYLASI